MNAIRSMTVGLMALFAAAPLSAQVVHDNGAPDLLSGNEMTNWVQADDFTIDGSATVGAVRFWAFGYDETSYQGSIFWQIMADGGGTPGAVLGGGLATPTLTPWTMPGYSPAYQLDFGVSALSLTDGVYWLALHNGPLGTETRENFYWATTTGNGTRLGREDTAPFDGQWQSNGGEHAFVLYGPDLAVVPEPASLVLTATGLLVVGAGALRRRRRNG